ncbi:MAG: hypothetical protein ABSG49_04340 [Methanoregula sp.]|jgi:hypothetical protein|uniref:hypothetical protein n=1 Tax=Methanoregula sp. TaxID=2052170 RepID=UPI003C23372B
MVRAFIIDSASTYELVSIFREKQPDYTYEWAWQSAIAVTNSIIKFPHLSMAPSPSIRGEASGPYGQLTNEINKMNGLVVQEQSNEHLMKMDIAKKDTIEWADTSTGEIRSAYEAIKIDHSFQKWLEGCIKHSWTEHTVRLGGLFNYEFIPQISQILNVDENNLKNIWEYSCNPKNLENYRNYGSDDLKIIEDAFVISALIRGRYHDKFAQLSDIQILHHPIREPILMKLNGMQKSEFDISNVDRDLSKIIIASAYAEKTQKDRISCYTENVGRARTAALDSNSKLAQKNYMSIDEDASFDVAFEIAKELNIRVYGKWVDEVIETCHIMGISFLGLVLNPFPGALLTISDWAVSKKIKPEKKLQLIFSKRRLRDLALSRSGRIEAVKK